MSAIATTGMTVRIIPRTTYNFDELTQDRMQFAFLAQHIDVGPFQKIDLAVNVYAATFGNAGCTMAVAVAPDGWTEEDPTATFLDMSRLASSGVLFGGGDTFPLFASVALPSGLGRLVTVVLIATKPNTGGLACSADVSVDLVVKEGDPSGISSSSCGMYGGYR